MRVIQTCPECGSDLHDLVLTCYPPKHSKMCMNCGWRYDFDNDDEVVRMPFIPPKKENIDRTTVITHDLTKEYQDPCLGCSNHPRNGGSGICNCTVPYLTPNSPYTITC